MLRSVSPVSRFTSTGLLGKVAASTHSNTPHTTSSVLASISSVQCGVLNLAFVGRRTFASTSVRGADITLTVDGKEVTVPQGFSFFWVFEHIPSLDGF